jgi:hypothetical protein
VIKTYSDLQRTLPEETFWIGCTVVRIKSIPKNQKSVPRYEFPRPRNSPVYIVPTVVEQMNIRQRGTLPVTHRKLITSLSPIISVALLLGLAYWPPMRPMRTYISQVHDMYFVSSATGLTYNRHACTPNEYECEGQYQPNFG